MSTYLLSEEYTPRLLFRKVLPTDFDTWLPFYDDPSSTEYWAGIPKDPKQACKQQFDRIFERYHKNLGGMNALILKENSQLIGLCGLLLQQVDGIDELEIGYSILPAFRNKGLAFEAAQKCKVYAFSKKLAASLISIIHVDNIPSKRVALKNGMFLDKTTVYKNNPVHIYRILNNANKG